MGFGATENLLPLYASCPYADPLPAVTTTNNCADSGLTCNLSASQKRPRDFNDSFIQKERGAFLSSHHLFSFLGQDVSLQIQQQQVEIDRFIVQHMERMRMDLAESRQQQSKQIFAAIKEGVRKRLKSKEEEIERMRSLNWALEERVKSLFMENQIWRDLARSNEATANALRSNLEQVLAQVSNEQQCNLADDAESCCDNSEEEEKRKLVEEQGIQDKRRSCRNCGEEESCVLLLPCRHLCLCTKCSSKLSTCPICKANMSSSVHVNMS